MDIDKQIRLRKLAKQTYDKYKTGAILGVRGYKFQVYKFLTTAFLYKNSVDVKNPDLLGLTNMNTQSNAWQAHLEKMKEQVRIDLREVGFIVDKVSNLAEYVVKAANRKILSKDNNFSDEWERVTDDAVDYGSGFLKIWYDDKKVLKLKALDPYAFAWNIYNFKSGVKIEQIKTTVTEMMKKDNWDIEAKQHIFNEVDKKNHDEQLVLYQIAKPVEKGDGYDVAIVSFDYDVTLWSVENYTKLAYIKIDYSYRRGFKDSLGIGAIETAFNAIVQDKTARERLDRVADLATTLMYQKLIDPKDKIAGKQIQKFQTGTILGLGSADSAVHPVDTGGINQITILNNELQRLSQDIQTTLRTPDVLNGDAKDLANSSGIAINYLQEFASSTHKDFKKRLARQLENLYQKYITPYILNSFDSTENLERHLSKTDYKYVQGKVVDFLLAQEQINEYSKGNLDYNSEENRERFTKMVQEKGIVAGGLLNKLRDMVKDISISVSGEKSTITAKKEFFQRVREQYFANPQIFATPFNMELLKKEATLSGVMTETEVEDFISKLLLVNK